MHLYRSLAKRPQQVFPNARTAPGHILTDALFEHFFEILNFVKIREMSSSDSVSLIKSCKMSLSPTHHDLHLSDAMNHSAQASDRMSQFEKMSAQKFY